jgi:transmembrane 9 superfamily member 3
VLIILIVVTICVTVVAVYFLLNSEDWRWPWTALLAAASTSGYVYLYGIYYFWFKTSMTGFLQTSYYFGYLGVFALALGLMCGAVGFLGAFAFVQRIFRNIKVD